MVKLMSSVKEKNILDKAQIPCQDFPLGREKVVDYDYVICLRVGLLMTTDDKGGRGCYERA